MFALTPVACTKYANYVISVRKAHGENVLTNPAKAEMPFLIGTVGVIFRDNTTRVCKGDLCLNEGHAMLVLILAILFGIPLEPSFGHAKA
jgi:hypothetical protein